VILRDGVPITFIEQERVTREKHSEDCSPFEAIEECLRVSGVPWSAVDEVVYGFDLAETYASVDRTLDDDALAILVPDHLLRTHRPEFRTVSHHLAHAASSFLCSHLREATILVADGTGESSATTLYYGNRNGIHQIRSFPTRLSLGFFYQAATFVAGFGGGAEGKLMGLAPYGAPRAEFHPFELTDDGYSLPGSEGAVRFSGQNFKTDLEPILQWWNERLSPYVSKTADVLHRADFAASVQAELERVMMHLVKLGVIETGVPDVIVAGGVGLNCSFNGKLQRSGLVRDLVVSPISSDVGIGLGAALYQNWKRTGKRPWRMRDAYLGPSWSDLEVDRAIRKFGLTSCDIETGERAWTRLLDLIASEKVIGWFDGAAEVGPRALGARSILADPREQEMTQYVNDVKGREFWRPLAPSILSEKFGTYFADAESSDFMLMALPVDSRSGKSIRATTHVDGTARPQSVGHSNPRYRELLLRWESKTGVPAILNTSFNLAGEPIVHSPFDALSTFGRSSLDALWLNSRLIIR